MFKTLNISYCEIFFANRMQFLKRMILVKWSMQYVYNKSETDIANFERICKMQEVLLIVLGIAPVVFPLSILYN